MSGGVPRTLRQRFEASERDLATSQADVTRLVVELAESVRALAVSRAENETTLRQHGDLCGEIEELRRALAVSQGERDRARELLAEATTRIDWLWSHLAIDAMAKYAEWSNGRPAFLAIPGTAPGGAGSGTGVF